jgi:RNA polymerase sigma-70 factor (ECF subfamily)
LDAAAGEADETLAARSRDGDRAAFEELARRTGRLVYAQLYLDVGRADRAEELTQETFLVALRHVRRLSDPKAFRPWLLSIARTVVIDDARRRGRRKRGSPGAWTDVPGDGPTPLESAERREARERAMSVLRSLPEAYQTPLTLRYLAGADHDEIGRQLGITNGSLRGLLHRGLTMLRERLQDDSR